MRFASTCLSALLLASAYLVQAAPSPTTDESSLVERDAIQARQVKAADIRNRRFKRSDQGCAPRPAPTTRSCAVPGGSQFCKACDGSCLDLSSNNNNCGTCGNRCKSNETCRNGRCKANLPPPTCDGINVVLDSLLNICVCADLGIVKIGSSRCTCDARRGLKNPAIGDVCVCATGLTWDRKSKQCRGPGGSFPSLPRVPLLGGIL